MSRFFRQSRLLNSVLSGIKQHKTKLLLATVPIVTRDWPHHEYLITNQDYKHVTNMEQYEEEIVKRNTQKINEKRDAFNQELNTLKVYDPAVSIGKQIEIKDIKYIDMLKEDYVMQIKNTNTKISVMLIFSFILIAAFVGTVGFIGLSNMSQLNANNVN